jgi:hypothetical protein
MTNPLPKFPPASPPMNQSLVEPNYHMPTADVVVASPAPPETTVARAVGTSPVTATPEAAKLSPVARLEQRIIALRSQIGGLYKELDDAIMDTNSAKIKRLQTKIASLVKQSQRDVISLHTAIEKHDRQTDSEMLIQLRKALNSDNRKQFVHFLGGGDYDKAAAMLRAVVLQ